MFFGLSAKGAVTPGHGQDAWRAKPIIFAMANPDPEITPEEVQGRARPTPSSPPGAATIPTRSTTSSASPTSSAARSTCARRTINDAMKIAAAEALAALAREDVPDEVDAAYRGRRLRYGPEYIIPVPFDPRLISARARRRSPRRRWRPASRAGRSSTWRRYRATLPRAARPHRRRAAADLRAACARNPRRVVFAEGEEEKRDPRRDRLRATRARHAGADRPRGAHRTTPSAQIGPRRRGGRRDPQCAPSRSTTSSYAEYPLRRAAAPRARCCATASAW